MPTQNHSKGAFQVSRSIFDSDIWMMPPEYLKLWIFIIGKASHKGKNYRGFACQRGEFFTTHEELEDNLSYQIGFRTQRPYEGRTKRITKYLTKARMIATTKAPRGILIKVLNYEQYQGLKHYERPHESTDERTDERPHESRLDAPSINKNGESNTDTTYPKKIENPKPPRKKSKWTREQEEQLQAFQSWVLEKLNARRVDKLSTFTDSKPTARIYMKHAMNLCLKIGREQFTDVWNKSSRQFGFEHITSAATLYNRLRALCPPSSQD